MAKAMLLNILVEHLSQFVDGLSGDNLKMSVFSGKIELSNLSLKESALEGIVIMIVVR